MTVLMDKLLTQQEGANRVGVSIETIQRYIDYGILDAVTDGNYRKIRVEDLDSVFSRTGTSLNVEAELGHHTVQKNPFFSNPQQDLHQDQSFNEDQGRYDEQENLASPHESLRILREKIVRRGPMVSQIASGDSGATRIDQPIAKSPLAASVTAHAHSRVIHHHNTQGLTIPPSSSASSATSSEQTSESTRTSSPDSPVLDSNLSRHVSSLPVSSLPVATNYDLITINKRLRDEIYELKKERDWLRERLEKVEARSEREQMLLLHESETVRALLNERPKRPFWTALPWFAKN